ncbi:MAG: hypothetical protein M1817_003123 [Caeruleum heppii]|nr:MAG: hypothetical protein M1817_003123 [Caeruleum heppii]
MAIHAISHDSDSADRPCLKSQGTVAAESRTPALPAALIPKESLLDYTEARLRMGLQIVEARLHSTQPIPPRLDNLLLQYKTAMETALEATKEEDEEERRNEDEGYGGGYDEEESNNEYEDGEDDGGGSDYESDNDDTPDKKLKAIFEVRRMERFFNDDDYLCATTTPAEEQIDANVLAFRKRQYMARYSPYLAPDPDQPCDAASLSTLADTAEEDAKLRAYFTDVWQQVIAERVRSKCLGSATKYLLKGLRNLDQQQNTTRDLYASITCLGFDYRTMTDAIEHYVLSNQWIGDNIQTLIDDFKWDDLKRILSRDLEDLPLTIPRARQADMDRLRTCIEGLRDEWFDTMGYPTNTNWWFPSTKATERWTRHYGRTERFTRDGTT